MLWQLIGIVALIGVLVDQAWTFFRPAAPRLYRPNPRLGWTLTPGIQRLLNQRHEGRLVWENLIRINSDGFNDREWPRTKGQAKRILIVGDSIVESRQISREKNFVSLTESSLNTTQSDVFEVFNAGVAGWSADSALNFFQQRGSALQPDAVILGLFTGNDLLEGDYDAFRYLFAYAWDCRRYDKPAFRMVNKNLTRSNFPAWRNISSRLFSEELYQRSRSFRWSYQQWNRRMAKTRNGSDLLRAKGISYNLFMEQSKGNRFYYDQTEIQIDTLASACAVQQCQFGVMLIPNFPLFYPLTEKDPQSRGFQEYQKDLMHYREMEQRLARKYPVLGLLELLHSATAPISYKPADPHLNEVGHQRVAQALSQFIKTNIVPIRAR